MFFNQVTFFGQRSIPTVRQWIFSPSGRTGIAIAGFGVWLDVLLLDVYNKLWSGHSLLLPDFNYSNVYTYHMLDETTLVVLEVNDNYQIRQYVIQVCPETRTARYEKTKVHVFIPRDDTPNRFAFFPTPHVPVRVGGKYYTAIYRHVNSEPPRMIVYLVPLDSSSDYPPMEFTCELRPPAELELAWREINGSLDHDEIWMNFTFYSTDSRLYFTSSCYNPTRIGFGCNRGMLITVDLSQLIDFYGRSFNQLDHQNIILEQVNYLTVVDTPWLREMATNQSTEISYRGGFIIHRFYNPVFQPNTREDRTIHLIESRRSVEIKMISESWLNWYPRGCLLQFKMSLADKRLFVRRAAYWNLSLSTIANNNLIFHPNRPLDAIEALHRMVFHDLHPIPLDEEAKKALGPYEEYKKMIENVYSSKEDQNRTRHPFLQAKMLLMLLVAFFFLSS